MYVKQDFCGAGSSNPQRLRKPVVRKTKAEAAATRESIIEAASHVFLERGVSGATLEQIAHAAGVTRGAVYWHFKNKRDVFLALHERLHVPFSEMVLQDLKRDHPEPLRQLEELCVQALRSIEENPQKKRILTILLLKCEYSGEMEELIALQNRARGKNFKLFDQYFERAIAKGYLSKSARPHYLTLSLFCYLTGILLESLRDPERIELRSCAAELVAQFFRGILNS